MKNEATDLYENKGSAFDEIRNEATEAIISFSFQFSVKKGSSEAVPQIRRDMTLTHRYALPPLPKGEGCSLQIIRALSRWERVARSRRFHQPVRAG